MYKKSKAAKITIKVKKKTAKKSEDRVTWFNHIFYFQKSHIKPTVKHHNNTKSEI